MSKIIIRNLGPIKDITLELNKINVIMGPQSSGKSTIAKIVSFCTWLDKKFSRDGLINRNESIINYIKELQAYHRLTGYFNDDTEFYFVGEFVELRYNICCQMTFEDKNCLQMNNFELRLKDSAPIDNNSKVIYIPAERNFVSVIYNLQEYLRDNDYIQDFVINWYEAKRKYSNDNTLNILNLGVQYYTEGEDVDRLYLGEGKNIVLQTASSGLQAVVPLITLFDYATKKIYNERRPVSVKERDELIKKLNQLAEDHDISKLIDLVNSRNYKYSQIIVEEPEQNLFPLTQRDLVYYMLQVCNDVNRNHRLTLTTNSPYILYALNNCMLGYLIKGKIPKNEQQKLKCKNAWIDPKLVSVWEIENGKIRSIQDNEGIVSENYFDLNMTELTDEYYQMLNYYDEN